VTLIPNTLFKDRYLIKRVIAQGGMGRVYEATDQRFKSEVAIKQALSFHNSQLRATFEREARLLAILKHPSIPRVTDYFTEEDGQFLIMDFVSGPNLDELLVQRNKPFPPDEAIELLDQLLATLEFLHSRASPIIHRDIKPLNLKLVDGQINLLDFGLAKGTPAYSQMSSGKSLPAYTHSYAPLEQIMATGTDARSDLFAAGATLYQLLTGSPPSPDANVRDSQVARGRPDPLKAPGVHPEIDTFVMRALALEAKDRFASATVMREILRQIKGMEKNPPNPTEISVVQGVPATFPGQSKRVVIDPNSAGFYAHKAGFYAYKGDVALFLHNMYAEAAAAYKEAVRLEPHNAEYHFNLGLALSRQKKYPEATAAFKEAVRLDPSNTFYHNRLGRAFSKQRKYAEAAAAYKEAIRLEPNNEFSHNGLGMAFYGQKKYAEAVAAYKEAVRLNPNNAEYHAEYHNNLGDALSRQKKYAEAAAAYKEAVRLKPSNAKYRNLLGDVFYQQKMYAEAIEAFKEAVRLKPHVKSYQQNLEKALKAMKG